MNEDIIFQTIKKNVSQSIDLVFIFGSYNNKDFCIDRSDLDICVIVPNILLQTMQEVEKAKQELSSKFNIPIDIKVYTYSQFVACQRGFTSGNLLTGWGLAVLARGSQKIVYKSDRVTISMPSQERIKSDALSRLTYYLEKMRKVVVNDKVYILRGTIGPLDTKETKKIMLSSFKNILFFYYATEGIVLTSISDLEKASHSNGNVKELTNHVRFLHENRNSPIEKYYLVYNKFEEFLSFFFGKLE